VEQRKLQLQSDEGTGATAPRASARCIPNNLEAGIPAKVAPVHTGALVLGELCGTPAATAGMTAGDVIVSVNGRAVTTPSSLTTVMKNFGAGSKVKVTWAAVGSGTHVTRTLDLAAAPPK
jgi:S1-C subfamily serine protease